MIGRMQRILGLPEGRRIAVEEVAYAEITANVTLTTATEASANLIVTLPELHFDGKTPHMIEFYTPGFGNTGDGNASLWLFQDGLSIGRLAFCSSSNSSAPVQTDSAVVCVSRRFVPPGGRHTYSIRGTRSAGSPVVKAGVGGSGAFMPARVRLLRIGGID